jgi:hypothetical protein
MCSDTLDSFMNNPIGEAGAIMLSSFLAKDVVLTELK